MRVLQNRLSYFCLDGKINAESLKGVIYGNPALQGGGGKHARPIRLEDGTRLKGGAWDLC